MATLSERVTGSPEGWRSHVGREREMSAKAAVLQFTAVLQPAKEGWKHSEFREVTYTLSHRLTALL